jgi:alkylated DNA repair dioxygenase AlkB
VGDVAQLELFDEGARVIVDDASGSIVYYPHAVSDDRAAALFDALLHDVQWRHERRMMYDREVDVPRLVASFRSCDPALPACLREVLPIAENLAGNRFNSVGLNLYRDGRDSVAPHNDTIAELQDDYPIGLLSLGSTRLMTIRSKARPRRVLDLDLEPGSFLVMSYGTQRTYDHAVPKTTSAVGPRISVAFRMRASLVARSR